MRSYIEVDTREEGALIRSGLNDPMVRALVKVVATLGELPGDRARARVLSHAAEVIAEETVPGLND